MKSKGGMVDKFELCDYVSHYTKILPNRFSIWLVSVNWCPGLKLLIQPSGCSENRFDKDKGINLLPVLHVCRPVSSIGLTG